MASETLERLHAAAKKRYSRWLPDWFEQSQAAWREYRTYADGLAARLPFRWHPVACDNPTQNHTGSTNGADHIVLDENYTMGRFHRLAGDALCRPTNAKWGVNLWGRSDNPTCKRCLHFAEIIVHQDDCDNCDGAGHYLLHSDTYGTDDDVVCWCCGGTGRVGGKARESEATR